MTAWRTPCGGCAPGITPRQSRVRNVRIGKELCLRTPGRPEGAHYTHRPDGRKRIAAAAPATAARGRPVRDARRRWERHPARHRLAAAARPAGRSRTCRTEEHTAELQSLVGIADAGFRFKKKNNIT